MTRASGSTTVTADNFGIDDLGLAIGNETRRVLDESINNHLQNSLDTIVN